MDFIKWLPYCVQRSIYLRTLIMRQPRKVLTSALKNDIESFKLIYKIIGYYFYIFSDNSYSSNYYLDWLENDILSEINDNVPMSARLSESMFRMFKGRTHDEIIMLIDDQNRSTCSHTKVILKYWKHMSYEKRVLLHDASFAYYQTHLPRNVKN